MNAPDFLRPAVGRTGFKEWTMPEVALLREIYPTQGPQGVMQRRSTAWVNLPTACGISEQLESSVGEDLVRDDQRVALGGQDERGRDDLAQITGHHLVEELGDIEEGDLVRADPFLGGLEVGPGAAHLLGAQGHSDVLAGRDELKVIAVIAVHAGPNVEVSDIEVNLRLLK